MTVENIYSRRDEQTSVYRQEVERITHVLMQAWEKAEKKPVSASYVATFVDMAKAIIEDNEQRQVHAIVADHKDNDGSFITLADVLGAIADKFEDSKKYDEDKYKALTWDERREETLERYEVVRKENASRNVKMNAASLSPEIIADIQQSFTNFVQSLGIENAVVELGEDSYSSSTHNFDYPVLVVTCAEFDKEKLPPVFFHLEVRTA